jgi:hypothetical protein
MNEQLLSDYEQLRLQNMRRNAAFMESLGIQDDVFAIQSDQARAARGRRRRNMRNDDDENDGNDGNDGYGGNSAVRMRSGSSAVPIRQMPPRAAKQGIKNYYDGDDVDG